MPNPLDKETLFTLTRALIKRKFYLITSHAKQRMAERSVTEEEIIHILSEPYELLETRWDEEKQKYKYKICGFYSKRAVVYAIDFDRLIVIVTVIGDD